MIEKSTIKLSDLRYYPPGKSIINRLREDKSSGTLTVNLHGLSQFIAIEYLLALWEVIESIRNKQIQHLEIIHGYRHGNALKGLVQLFFEDKPCIISDDTQNPGSTHIFLIK